MLRVAAFLLCVACLHAGPVLALSAAPLFDEKSTTVADVGVLVRDPWPDMLYRGYFPVYVELDNRSSDAREIALTLRHDVHTREARVTKHVVLAPGERASLELFAPAFPMFSSEYVLLVEAGGEREWLPGVGCAQQANLAVRSVLFVSQDAPEPGAIARWASEVGAHEPADRAPGPMHPQGTTTVHVGRSPARMPAASTSTWSIEIVDASFRALPTRHEPYTSLDAVVLDVGHGLPPRAQLEPLLAWVRLGGCVALVGPNAAAIADLEPELARWREPRFADERAERTEVHAIGFGVLVVASEPPFASESQRRLLANAIERPLAWTANPARTNTEWLAPALSGLDLPYRALTLLLIAFAVVIGPLNLWYVRRKAKPVLLLVTVPAISAVFALGLFAYGALHQGLDIRAASTSYTLLDQRDHRSSSVEARRLFAGLPAGPGLRPGAGTSCHPLPKPWGRIATEHVLDFDEGLVLAGEYLPVRTPVDERFLVDRASRLRLGVRREGAGFDVENGLSAPIESLVLRDADGGWHTIEGRLDPGESATTTPSDASAAGPVRDGSRRPGGLDPTSAADLPPGAYFATLASSPFLDDCAIEYDEEAGQHHLLGILEADLETGPEGSR